MVESQAAESAAQLELTLVGVVQAVFSDRILRLEEAGWLLLLLRNAELWLVCHRVERESSFYPAIDS